MQKKLFFFKPYGRLGNRLLRYSHVASWCWENNLTLWDPTLSDYPLLFPAFHGDPLFSINIQPHRTRSVLASRRILRFLIVKMANHAFLPQLSCENRAGRFFELNGEEGMSWLRKNKTHSLIGIDGFWYTSGGLREKYRDRLTQIFTPPRETLDCIDLKLSNVDPGKALIGIHIRRTDYRTFLDGDGYYEWEEYQSLLLLLMNEIGVDKVQFLICCDEPIPDNFGHGLPIAYGLGSINDIFTLSYCDLIIGPRSTFSNWAAYIGKSSLIELWGHPIWKKDQKEALGRCLSSLNLNRTYRNPFLYKNNGSNAKDIPIEYESTLLL
jgi:hypothetical protein